METREHIYNELKKISDDENGIGLVLLEIGEDPEATEFPDGTLEKAAKVFSDIGSAATKVIEAGTPVSNSTAMIQQVSAVASELLESCDISISPDVMMLLAESTVMRITEFTNKLFRLQERTLINGLNRNQMALDEMLLNLSLSATENLDDVLGDEAQATLIEALVSTPKPNSSVQNFMNLLDARRKVNKQLEGQVEQQRAALPRTKPNIKAFLAARNL